MVSVPVRAFVPPLAVTLTLTTPAPVLLLPPVIDNQPLSEAAVHAQLAAVETFTEPDPPAASKDSVAGDSVYAHGVGAGSLGDFEPQAIEAAASTRNSTK